MRLLNVRTFTLHTFYGDNIPPYAILSHTWLRDDEEVTFASITSAPPTNAFQASWRNVPGAKKIVYLCDQAADDGLDYAWADTCCIDKTNSVELSEAINSMFKWYQRSRTCYAYLADVDKVDGGQIEHSRWWDRAWTLQELVAPVLVHFYDKHWQSLGTKEDLLDLVSLRCGVDHETLKQPDTMYVKSVAQRMSWAAHREATRLEDRAYSLLGIFDVNLSMQYGEGSLAFKRLQEMILQKSNDQTLFAWGFSPRTIEETMGLLRVSQNSVVGNDYQDTDGSLPFHADGIFAESPTRFAGCGKLKFYTTHASTSHIAEFNGALRMETPLARIRERSKLGLDQIWKSIYFHRYIGILPCGYSDRPGSMVGILLEEWTSSRFRRVHLVPGAFTFLVDCHTISRADQRTIWIDNLPWLHRHQYGLEKGSNFHRSVRLKLALPLEDYKIAVESANTNWVFDESSSTLERYHAIDSTNCYLQVDLRRHKQSDSITIVVEFANHTDDIQEPLNDQIYILRRTSHGDELRVATKDQHRKQSKRAASLEEIAVRIETHQIYNQLISTLVISRFSTPELAAEYVRSLT
jgi:hypothetical protein